MRRMLSFRIERSHHNVPIEVVSEYVNPFGGQPSLSVSSVYNDRTADGVLSRLRIDWEDVKNYRAQAKRDMTFSAQAAGFFTLSGLGAGFVAHHYHYKINHSADAPSAVGAHTQEGQKTDPKPPSQTHGAPQQHPPQKMEKGVRAPSVLQGHGKNPAGAQKPALDQVQKKTAVIEVPAEKQSPHDDHWMLYGAGGFSALFAVMAVGFMAGAAWDYRRFVQADSSLRIISKAQRELTNTFRKWQMARTKHGLEPSITDCDACRSQGDGRHPLCPADLSIK